MSDYVTVGAASEFASGEFKPFLIEGEAVILVRIGEAFYCVSDFCTHEAVSFSSGYGLVASKAIICMLHGSAFELESGDILSGPADQPLKKFDVLVEEGVVKIKGK